MYALVYQGHTFYCLLPHLFYQRISLAQQARAVVHTTYKCFFRYHCADEVCLSILISKNSRVDFDERVCSVYMPLGLPQLKYCIATSEMKPVVKFRQAPTQMRFYSDKSAVLAPAYTIRFFFRGIRSLFDAYDLWPHSSAATMMIPFTCILSFVGLQKSNFSRPILIAYYEKQLFIC